MCPTLRSIARLLVAILLATVLSPSFAWEATSARSTHERGNVAPDGSEDTHDQDTHAPTHHGDEESHHHGCAGHLLGHLPMHITQAIAFAMLDTVHDGFPDLATDFSSPFPDGLYRPPLAPTLA